MADFKTALEYVLGLEVDPNYPDAITLLKGDKGGKTRLGLAATYHTDLAKQGFYDGDPIEGKNPQRWNPTTITPEKALTIAQGVYSTEYAIPLAIDKIEDQELANSLFAFGVHAGPRQAAVILQRALPIVPQDGYIGPKTLATIAAADAEDLRGRFAIERSAFYARMMDAQPELAQYAQGMLNRSKA